MPLRDLQYSTSQSTVCFVLNQQHVSLSSGGPGQILKRIFGKVVPNKIETIKYTYDVS